MGERGERRSQESGVGSRERDDFGVKAGGCQNQAGDGDGEAESAGAGAAGVDVQDTGAKLVGWHVAVAADDGSEAGGRGVEVELVDVVKDVEDGVLDFDDLGFRQALCPGVSVDIAADCGDRGDGCERLENVWSADVARMNDAVGAAESFKSFGSQKAVSVGDQTDGGGSAGHSFNVAGSTWEPNAT
jgi:hypothetical protein